MLVKELLERLSFGELSNIYIGDHDDGVIPAKHHPQIITHLNEALTKLFGRFVLREKSFLLESVPEITSYHLKSQFSESKDVIGLVHYIKDLPNDPFEDDLIKVLSVHDHNGFKYPLNDTGHPLSLFTPQPLILQIPFAIERGVFAINYQARHPKILFKNTQEGYSYLDQEIEVPFFLGSAVQSYIAYKIYSHMNGPEHSAKAQEHMAEYERTCMEVENRDLLNETFHTSHYKLEQRGFV